MNAVPADPSAQSATIDASAPDDGRAGDGHLNPSHAPSGDALVACPNCDALYRTQPIAYGQAALCRRCGATIFAPRAGAAVETVALAAASLVLMTVAVGFPFLRISESGFSNSTSVLGAVLALGREDMLFLALAVGAMIIALPVLRLAALIYALAPVMSGGTPAGFAAPALRLALRLRPWAMVEVFMIGVAVAVIKVAELADLAFGPAFWAFAALALLVMVQDRLTCERSLWHVLDTSAPS